MLAPTRWSVRVSAGQCAFFPLSRSLSLSLSLSLPPFSWPPPAPSVNDFHGPSGGVAKYRFVGHRLSARDNHPGPVIVIAR